MQQAQIELWVLEAQSGDKDAFSALCEHFYPKILGFAVKIGADIHLAEDAGQEALLKLSRTIYKLRDPASINSWVYKLVRWQVLDLMKSGQRYQSLDNSEIVASEPDDRREELSELLQQLPPVERQVLFLFYLEQFSITEIGRILEIPTGTVKSRLFRARKLLKQCIE